MLACSIALTSSPHEQQLLPPFLMPWPFWPPSQLHGLEPVILPSSSQVAASVMRLPLPPSLHLPPFHELPKSHGHNELEDPSSSSPRPQKVLLASPANTQNM